MYKKYTTALAIILPAMVALNTNAQASNAQASPEPSPYQLSLLYTGEEWYNARGGLKQGTVYMQNIDAKLAVDAAKAFGWTGGNFVLEGWMSTSPSLVSRLVGNTVDWQSPIENSINKNVYRLYQAYYDQDLGDTNIRFGIYDLETEFSSTKPMSLFLSKNLTWNTVLDDSGTASYNGNVGPGNYPWTPLALRIRQKLSKDWSVQAAIADGIADSPYNRAANHVYFNHRFGTMNMAEVDYVPSKYTKLFAGGWYLGAKIQTNNEIDALGNPKETYGEEGGFFGGTTRIYTQEGRRGLDAFFTAGFSNSTSTVVYQSLNGGLVYTGLFDARPVDKIGVSFNVNAAPGSYRRAQMALGSSVSNYEQSYEATYRARITDWLTVQPDVQYIIDPLYDRSVKNDLLFGLHFEVGHLFDL